MFFLIKSLCIFHKKRLTFTWQSGKITVVKDWKGGDSDGLRHPIPRTRLIQPLSMFWLTRSGAAWATSRSATALTRQSTVVFANSGMMGHFCGFPRFEYRCWLWNDSTSVKAHLQKWEPNSENNQFIGTSRGEKTTKICAVVDMPLVIRCILFLQRTGSWRRCRNPFAEGSIHLRKQYSWRQSTWFLQNSGIHHFQRSNLYNSAHGELRRAVVLWFYTYKERHLVECILQ